VVDLCQLIVVVFEVGCARLTVVPDRRPLDVIPVILRYIEVRKESREVAEAMPVRA
jgi:hypothetical protein